MVELHPTAGVTLSRLIASVLMPPGTRAGQSPANLPPRVGRARVAARQRSARLGKYQYLSMTAWSAFLGRANTSVR